MKRKPAENLPVTLATRWRARGYQHVPCCGGACAKCKGLARDIDVDGSVSS